MAERVKPYHFMPLSKDTSAKRQWIFEANLLGLRELSRRANRSARPPSSHFLICIDVDDNVWRWVVDDLMPGYDWAGSRDRGAHPFARGIVPWTLFEEVISRMVPGLETAREAPGITKTGHKVVVCGDGGATLRPLF